jgi:SnoaL-like domain
VFNRCMLSLAEISDRLEIQQLLVDYSTAVDNRRFEDLDDVFTPDAYIDLQALKAQ